MKFSNGRSILFATIKDEDFVNSVLDGKEDLSAGEFLVVDLLISQSIENNKIITSYIVQKVLEHKKAPKQLTFPM